MLNVVGYLYVSTAVLKIGYTFIFNFPTVCVHLVFVIVMVIVTG